MATDPDKLTQIGDALDAAEREFCAAHPQRPAGHAIWNGRVGSLFDRYRKAARVEIGKRASAYRDQIMQARFPASATSLRMLVDAEAQRIVSSRSAKQNMDFQNRVAMRRQRWRDAARLVKPL